MQKKEVEEYLKSLQTAVEEKQPSQNVINILLKLQKDLVPTEELLRSTKAGVAVARLRAEKDKNIAKLASEVVGKWKKAVEQEKKAKMSGGASKSGPVSSPATNTSTPATPAPDGKGFAGDVSKRKWETDGVDIKRTGVPTRDNCVGLLYNGLAFMSSEAPSKIVIKAIEVERACYDHFRSDNAEYKTKLRSLFQNLKNKQNRELGPKVLSGDIPAAKFITLSHDELKSEMQKKIDEKLEYENMKMAQVPMAEKSISDALKCGKCGQKKVSYSQAQTRSADEPMTTFCECTVCGNRWKFS